MTAKTEEFLYWLLWGAETLARPTFRNLTESFEGWAYRTGALAQLRRLEAGQLIEKKASGTVERIYRLTEKGRLAALGGRDPEARWNRYWDGQWRIVAFDLPEEHNASRVRLRRHLKERGFGYLQNSVWITPDPLDTDLKKLSAKGEDVEALLTLEARPCSGESDESIVAGAWNFARINRLYQDCLHALKNPPGRKRGEKLDFAKLREWARQERAAWMAALWADPLLPSRLLPSDYLGKRVWELRNTVLREGGHWLG